MKYIPQSPEDQRDLLKSMGLQDVEELFTQIPKSLRLSPEMNYPPAQSEQETRKTFQSLSSLSKISPLSFAGCGIYSHDVPSIVPFIQGRSEFATAYTPYQPEISQGLLQAIYEFQTLACQLTAMELSKASLYDGATSLAEGVLMALRLKKKSEGKIAITSALHPHYREVLNTYCQNFKDRMIDIPLSSDRIDLEAAKKILSDTSVDIFVTQSPNIFGVIEDYEALGRMVKNSGALWVTSTMEPVSFGALEGPGAFGAHIATAEGQSFGNAPFLGGSSYGFFCTKNDYLRNLPGRLVGETIDESGKRSYTLTFATREQFIRRDKATSNICTNNNLNMLAGLIHLATLGKRGIQELAVQNLSLSEWAKTEIRKISGLKISASPTFNEFVVDLPMEAAKIIRLATAEGWVAGVDLGRFKTSWKHKLLIHVSEIHSPDQIQKLVELLKKSL